MTARNEPNITTAWNVSVHITALIPPYTHFIVCENSYQEGKVFDSRCKNDFDITFRGLLTIEVYTMQTANMMAHAKSTFIPVTENE